MSKVVTIYCVDHDVEQVNFSLFSAYGLAKRGKKVLLLDLGVDYYVSYALQNVGFDISNKDGLANIWNLRPPSLQEYVPLLRALDLPPEKYALAYHFGPRVIGAWNPIMGELCGERWKDCLVSCDLEETRFDILPFFTHSFLQEHMFGLNQIEYIGFESCAYAQRKGDAFRTMFYNPGWILDLRSSVFQYLLDNVKEDYDYVLVNAPSGMDMLHYRTLVDESDLLLHLFPGFIVPDGDNVEKYWEKLIRYVPRLGGMHTRINRYVVRDVFVRNALYLKEKGLLLSVEDEIINVRKDFPELVDVELIEMLRPPRFSLRSKYDCSGLLERILNG